MNELHVAIIGCGRSGQSIHDALFASEANAKHNVVCVAGELEIHRQNPLPIKY